MKQDFGIGFADEPSNTEVLFQEVSGMEEDVAAEEVSEGGENRFAHALPKSGEAKHLVLKRGQVSRDSMLYRWCKSTLEADLTKPITPQNLVASLLDQHSKVVMVWDIERAYPMRWEIGGLSTQNENFILESLELTCKFIKRRHE